MTRRWPREPTTLQPSRYMEGGRSCHFYSVLAIKPIHALLGEASFGSRFHAVMVMAAAAVEAAVEAAVAGERQEGIQASSSMNDYATVPCPMSA
jgi:hypothetical protein